MGVPLRGEVQRAHDPSAVIAEFTLRDLLAHARTSSTECYSSV
jgi:hypothetical protein